MGPGGVLACGHHGNAGGIEVGVLVTPVDDIGILFFGGACPGNGRIDGDRVGGRLQICWIDRHGEQVRPVRVLRKGVCDVLTVVLS